jgi:hypothetical protein
VAPGSAAGELAADGAGLAGAVEDAGEVLAGGFVVEVDLDLDDAEAGAEGVDRHGDLDPEPGGEREEGREGLPADGALAGEGLGHGAAGGSGHAAAGQAHGHAEPAGALLGGEVGDRQVGLRRRGPGRAGGRAGPPSRPGRRRPASRPPARAEPFGDPAHQGGQAGVEGSALAQVARQVQAVGARLQGLAAVASVEPSLTTSTSATPGRPRSARTVAPDPLGLVLGRHQGQHRPPLGSLGPGPALVGS